MAEDDVKQGILRYDKMVEDALRQVLRQSLQFVVTHGLPGEHHFYITFRTDHPEVVMPGYLRKRYPDEMTIVLQHQFWNLEVAEEYFSVSLSFSNKPELLVIPFAAVATFADPSVRFGLQFETGEGGTQEDEEAGPLVKLPEVAPPDPATAENADQPDDGENKEGAENIVALDRFRKK
ncbi:MAG: ClpXP protease specificity-enhancing factor SspB [Kiloniellales bacterium]|nr:ClpXP protease specificity-enhancing factor SspB [Kiloniellales bacterium]